MYFVQEGETQNKPRTWTELHTLDCFVCAVYILLLLLWFLNLCCYSTDFFFLYFDPPFFEIPVKKKKVLEIKLFKKPFSWCHCVYFLPVLVSLSWILAFIEDTYLHILVAAVMKYHRLGGLNNKHLFLIVLEAVPGYWCSWILAKALFLICRWPSSGCVFTRQRAEKERKQSLYLLPIMGTILIHKGPTVMTRLPPKDSTYITLRVSISTYAFLGDTFNPNSHAFW